MASKRKKTRSTKISPTQKAYVRFLFIVAVLSIWALVVGAKLVYLQVYNHSELRAKALKKRERSGEIKSPRGQILDRNGRVLAIDIPSLSLTADPKLVDDPLATATAIGKVIKINVNEVAKQIKALKDSGGRDLVIARDVDTATAQAINARLETPKLVKAELPRHRGLYWRTESRRSYPHGTTAAQLIGHKEGEKGVAGIERSHEKLLAPRTAKREWVADNNGRSYQEEAEKLEQASDVVLTIDITIQNIAEQALAKAINDSSARSGVAIVMNPKNGEILAMANHPTFDPNRITPSTQSFTKNLAVETHYDPGSVFKVVTYGAGLEKGDFKPEDEIDLGNGTINVGGRQWVAKNGNGRVTYAQGLSSSNNICAIKTALKVGSEGLFSMSKKMGFGERTGIELPFEAPGIIAPPSAWTPTSIGSKAVGYENSASPLQIATAFATIAHDGVRVRPHVVREVKHSDDKPMDVTQVQSTQAFTAETARGLRAMLKHVVTSGTGKRAQVNNYSVAGKTGTAWKYDNSNGAATGQKLISSFVGMAPADSPELVIAVVLDEPKNGGRDAGLVAAPVFSEIAEAVLRYLNVAPDQPGVVKAPIVAKSDAEKKPTDTQTKKAQGEKQKVDAGAVGKKTDDKKTEKKPTVGPDRRSPDRKPEQNREPRKMSAWLNDASNDFSRMVA